MRNIIDKFLVAVPFMYCNKKWQERVGERLFLANFTNSLISPGVVACLSFAIFYSLCTGKPILDERFYSNSNYSKQQEFLQNQAYQNSLRQEFQRADSDSSGNLDLREFINYREGRK